MLTILFEGWTKFPHSYCIFNVNQLVVMAMKMKDSVKVYVTETPPFGPDWHIYDSMENIILTAEEQLAFASIEVWDGKKPIDVIWRSWFPFDATDPLYNVPVALQYTAEFRILLDEYFKKPSNLSKFIEKCKMGQMIGIIPSKWNSPALGNPEYSVVVPHGCDITKFYPYPQGGHQVRTCLRIPLTDFVFLNVGAMTENKNIRGILMCFYTIARTNDKVWLLLKGLDSLYPCKKNIDKTINKLVATGAIDAKEWDKISARVIYMDGALSYKSLNDIYNMADCYITPYSAEGFNIPALEAQACGIPIIATKGGPTDEFLSHEGSTIFVPSTTAVSPEGLGQQLAVSMNELLKAMLTAINSRDDLKRIAMTVGVEYVRDNFTWVHATEKLIVALRSLVAKRSLVKPLE